VPAHFPRRSGAHLWTPHRWCTHQFCGDTTQITFLRPATCPTPLFPLLRSQWAHLSTREPRWISQACQCQTPPIQKTGLWEPTSLPLQSQGWGERPLFYRGQNSVARKDADPALVTSLWPPLGNSVLMQH
jgi:hypothetical protein